MRLHLTALRTFFSKHGGVLAGALVGFIWFVRCAGFQVLDPTDVGWVLSGEDWTQHFLGWAFFRHAPWAFPLGRIDGYLYPLGVATVAMTDSNPWVSLLLKPISPLLPADFQFLGPWLAFCFAAQGAAGAWLARTFTSNAFAQAASGALFALSPVLINRIGHDTLCAQFVLVLLIGLHLVRAPERKVVRRHLGIAAGLVAFSAGVHPYLAAMALALAAALVIKLALADRAFGWLGAGAAIGALFAVALLVSALFGYFAPGVSAGIGFGYYNSAPLALVNPRGLSHVLPSWAPEREHYEGYGFLGLGVFLAMGAGAVSAWFRRKDLRRLPWRRTWALAAISFALFFFSFGSQLRWGNRTLLDLSFLYRGLDMLTGAFRGSGRFVWVIHYAVIACAVAFLLWAWRDRPRIAAAILASAALAHALDFMPRIEGVFSRAALGRELRSNLWDRIGTEYRHLAILPPQINGNCPGGLHAGTLHYVLGHIAARQQMTINSGYLARVAPDMRRATCERARELVVTGELDPQTVYVVDRPRLARLLVSPGRPICGVIDGYDVCVARGRDTELVRAFMRSPPAAGSVP
ncbi:MAG: hypothetical protein IRZ16_13780 [Myxococcaceae bacterium]|nr:hypothetical protein [Myxococcaceae bacterium]